MLEFGKVIYRLYQLNIGWLRDTKTNVDNKNEIVVGN
jgi:hypothetical protein